MSSSYWLPSKPSSGDRSVFRPSVDDRHWPLIGVVFMSQIVLPFFSAHHLDWLSSTPPLFFLLRGWPRFRALQPSVWSQSVAWGLVSKRIAQAKICALELQTSCKAHHTMHFLAQCLFLLQSSLCAQRLAQAGPYRNRPICLAQNAGTMTASSTETG